MLHLIIRSLLSNKQARKHSAAKQENVISVNFLSLQQKLSHSIKNFT